MIIDQYKSILVNENKRGEVYLYPRTNSDIINQIIPDALEYVKNHNSKFKDGINLCGLNGVDMKIYPNSTLEALLKDWGEEYFLLSGIAVEI